MTAAAAWCEGIGKVIDCCCYSYGSMRCYSYKGTSGLSDAQPSSNPNDPGQLQNKGSQLPPQVTARTLTCLNMANRSRSCRHI